jgi:uncharacterized membrane protein HdeD (DUF308 family)
MDLSGIANTAVTFSRDNPIIAIVGGLFLLFLLYRKPKLFFGLLILALIVAGVFYFIMDVASTGKSGKTKIIETGTRPDIDQTR